MNTYLSTVVIAPMTSQSKLPTRVHKNTTIKGWVVIDQIRTIDKQRIVRIVDKLAEKKKARLKYHFEIFVE